MVNVCSLWRSESRGLALLWLNEIPVCLRHYSTRHIDVEIGLLGSAEVKTCYKLSRDYVLGNLLSSSSRGDPFRFLWKALWSANIPGKVAICAWRVCNNLLPTRAQLSTKGYMGDLRCLLCSHSFETIGHIVCECPVAQEISQSRPPFSLQLHTPHSFSFKEWMLEQASSMSSEAFARLLMFV